MADESFPSIQDSSFSSNDNCQIGINNFQLYKLSTEFCANQNENYWFLFRNDKTSCSIFRNGAFPYCHHAKLPLVESIKWLLKKTKSQDVNHTYVFISNFFYSKKKLS